MSTFHGGHHDSNGQTVGYRVVALAVRVRGVGKGLPDPPVISIPDSCRMRVLSRLTVCLSDANSLYQILQQKSFKDYDLFAIEAGTDSVLNQVSSGSIDPDILSFGPSHGLDVKRANLSLPQTKGLCIEINYTNTCHGREDGISAAQLLVQKTKGKNLIISSGAVAPFSLRGPNDVKNLAPIFGLNQNQGQDAVFRNGLLCLKHADGRRNSAALALTLVKDPDDPKSRALKKRLQLLNPGNAPHAKKGRSQ